MRTFVVCFALFALTLSGSVAGLAQAQPPQQQAEPPFPAPLLAGSSAPEPGSKQNKKPKKALDKSSKKPDSGSKKKDQQQMEKR
jgi:hypothetical protein